MAPARRETLGNTVRTQEEEGCEDLDCEGLKALGFLCYIVYTKAHGTVAQPRLCLCALNKEPETLLREAWGGSCEETWPSCECEVCRS